MYNNYYTYIYPIVFHTVEVAAKTTKKFSSLLIFLHIATLSQNVDLLQCALCRWLIAIQGYIKIDLNCINKKKSI